MILILTFICSIAARGQVPYSVVITELMADPSPTVGLPNNEWIELKNCSNGAINLSGWRIADATGQSGPMPVFTLAADSFVIVCSSTASASMSLFGKTITVTSFPSLDNDGDLLSLKAGNGKTIHAVNYSSEWYRNPIKKEGGWTLEMIDARHPCMGAINWKAGITAEGGTPGKKNSIDSILSDNDPPVIIRATTADAFTINLEFNEPVDSLQSTATALYSIVPNVPIGAVSVLPPLFNQVQLRTNTAITSGTIYNITINGIKDCNANTLLHPDTVRTGLPAAVNANDIILNEVLFDPPSGGSDYVEFLNRSNKVIDLSKLYIANSKTPAPGTSKVLSTSARYLLPGEYLLVSADTSTLAQQYDIKNRRALSFIPVLPSYASTSGTVCLLDAQGNIIDAVDYLNKWHFKLIADPKGVSLERIDPEVVTQLPGNWHSAASTAGNGTPGYKNSQYRPGSIATGKINVLPPVFSPDNDGRDDIATLMYEMTEPGYVANIFIFDAAGRLVNYFVKSALLGIKGSWNWDGLDERARPLPQGIYVFLAELFNLDGKRQIIKLPVVLAR